MNVILVVHCEYGGYNGFVLHSYLQTVASRKCSICNLTHLLFKSQWTL